MTDARNGGKLTKFAFESYWEKSQQFSLFHQITTYNEKRDKRRLPAHTIRGVSIGGIRQNDYPHLSDTLPYRDMRNYLGYIHAGDC